MSELDPGILKPWLDEYEKYAIAIDATDPRFAIAKKILEAVSEARDSLKPSADSTINFVPNKGIIEHLAMLREQAEDMLHGK